MCRSLRGNFCCHTTQITRHVTTLLDDPDNNCERKPKVPAGQKLFLSILSEPAVYFFVSVRLLGNNCITWSRFLSKLTRIDAWIACAAPAVLIKVWLLFCVQVTSLVVGFVCKLHTSFSNTVYLKQLVQIGFLAQFESLLSTNGTESSILLAALSFCFFFPFGTAKVATRITLTVICLRILVCS